MDPFLGEVASFGFNFAPQNWAMCNGALLPLNQNTALFSLLGVTFGGDGRNNFGLPNLIGRSPCGVGQGPGLTPRALGDAFGATSVTLNQTMLPQHQHGLNAVSVGRGSSGAVGTPTTQSGLANPANGVTPYAGGSPTAAMGPTAIGMAGSGGPHNNQQPNVAINYCIAVQGIYPTFD